MKGLFQRVFMMDGRDDRLMGESFAMGLHVLADGVGEAEGGNAGVVGVKAGGTGRVEDAEGVEVLYDWLIEVEGGIRGAVKEHDKVVFIAAGSLEDLLYFFYCRAFEKKVAEMRGGAGDDKGREGEEADEIYVVQVVCGVCRELGELRRAAGREVSKCAGEADSGCELFTRDELESVFEECRKVHEGIVADGAWEGKIFND